MLARLALALPVALLGACTSETASTPAAPPADAADANVVAIVSPNGDPTFVCTAEVIAPRVVLSAGHCFRGGNYDKTGWTFELFLGGDVHAPATGDRRIAVTEFRLHPDYQSTKARADGSDADIAVAFVGEDLALPALAFNAAALPTGLEGRVGRYVGFGANDEAAKGRRHSEAATLQMTAPDVVAITASRIPCHGDSGGPFILALGGRDTIVGVGHTTNVDDAGNCVLSSTYTRTDLFEAFLTSALVGH